MYIYRLSRVNFHMHLMLRDWACGPRQRRIFKDSNFWWKREDPMPHRSSWSGWSTLKDFIPNSFLSQHNDFLRIEGPCSSTMCYSMPPCKMTEAFSTHLATRRQKKFSGWRWWNIAKSSNGSTDILLLSIAKTAESSKYSWKRHQFGVRESCVSPQSDYNIKTLVLREHGLWSGRICIWQWYSIDIQISA